MTGAEGAEASQALRRGFALRIGVALALLAVIGVAALTGFVGPGTSAESTSVEAGERASVQTQSADSAAPPKPIEAPSAAAAAGPVERAAQSAQDPAAAADALAPGVAAAPEATAASHARAGDAGGAVQSASTVSPARTAQPPDAAAALQSSPAGDQGSGIGTQTESAPDKTQSPRELSTAGKGKPGAGQARFDPAQGKADASPTAPRTSPPKQAHGPRLQAGVFLQSANAQALKSRLEAEGFPVYIETRVQIGPFKDRREAERAREKLREMGVTTVLIKP